MRAAICYEFGTPLVVEEVTLPPPNHGEVQVTLKACAICHSDIAYMEGEWGGDLPMIYGHEAAGVVSHCGEGVKNLAVGDHVLVTLLRNCGACGDCQTGHSFTCGTAHALDEEPLRTANGTAILRGLKTAAFAEEVVVDQSQVIAIPKDLDFAEASLLSCGVLTGFGAVSNVAKVQAGQSAVVIGCGGVGLNAVQGLSISGATPIIAVDLVDAKLQAAKDFGATHVLNAIELGDNLSDAVQKITSGGGGADFIFVAAGGSKAVMSGLSLLANNGALVIMGMTKNGDYSTLDSTDLAGGNKRILGSKMGSSRLSVDIPRLLSLHSEGRLKLKELISGRFSLDDINQAISEVKQDKALRNVVVFD